jgi:hypothetical protein
MTEEKQNTNTETETETFPVEPRYHPIHIIPRKIYDFLASAKLAMVLLITILVCCLIGVTLFRGVRAGEVIFGTLWFNALLVLLIVNIACCFFGRVWHRRLTVISFGMIVFHLSFVSILGGVIYNSLFYFRGNIRLTEGEMLPSDDPQSYDSIDKGAFFSFSRLKGETSLTRMHSGYKVSGDDKRAAYEVMVGEGGAKKQGILYITNKLTYRGVDYFNDKEGYALLLTLADRQGQIVYGAHIPLQSIPQKDEGFQYVSGYKDGANVVTSVVPFPAPPEKPRVALKVEYLPSKLKERTGEARFQIYALDGKELPDYEKLIVDGKVPIGKTLPAGDYAVSAQEVRYWVSMMVRHEPGKPIVLTSLWAGLAGMIITTIGRMLRSPRRENQSKKAEVCT